MKRGCQGTSCQGRPVSHRRQNQAGTRARPQLGDGKDTQEEQTQEEASQEEDEGELE